MKISRLSVALLLTLSIATSVCHAGEGRSKDKASKKAVSTTEVTLLWEIPSRRLDGSSLDASELTHYVVSYSDSLGLIRDEFTVNFGDSAQVVIGELPQGEYTFTIFAVDVYGAQSPTATLQQAL